MMEIIAGLSLGLSVGAFVLSAWTFIQRRYTADDVQGRVNQAFYAGQAAAMGAAAVTPSVPTSPQSHDDPFDEEPGKESIGGFNDGEEYGIDEFLAHNEKKFKDEFKNIVGDVFPMQGMSVR
jgi:hypothetical protein